MSRVDVLALLEELHACSHKLPRFQMRAELVAAHAAVAELIKAAKLQDRLNKEALPKFNWGASALDANAITLLNEAPGALSLALANMGEK